MTHPTQIAELRRHADNLQQSDTGWRQAGAVYAQIAELERELLESQGLYLSAPCTAHVDAYRAALAAAERAEVMATVSPRMREALEDIQAGRIGSRRTDNFWRA